MTIPMYCKRCGKPLGVFDNDMCEKCEELGEDQTHMGERPGASRKIVIEISEEEYKRIKADHWLNDGVYLAIKNGTPLDDIRQEISNLTLADYTREDIRNTAVAIIDKHISGKDGE